MRAGDFSIICTMVLALMLAGGGAAAADAAAGVPAAADAATARPSEADQPDRPENSPLFENSLLFENSPLFENSLLFQPHSHTIGLELGFVLIPFGFDDPYSAPIGASLFYEFRPGLETLPIFIGAIVSSSTLI